MLLAIDIGNSTIVIGVFHGDTLKGHWRLATDSSKTEDDYGIPVLGLFEAEGLSPQDVSGVIISSVVPSLTSTFETLSERHFCRRPLIVSCDSPTGLVLKYQNPHEIGADRLVNAAAAYHRYQTALIIVDFGTATTFCAVTGAGEYLGGAIAPGIGISAEALAARTAKLPKVDLERPKTVIGVDTFSSMQSGLIYGFAGMVDAMVARIEADLGERAKVIGTGGLASVVAPETRTIQEVRPFLTLEGLQLLYRRSCGDE